MAARREVEESILPAGRSNRPTGGAVAPDRIARLPAGRFGVAEPKGPGRSALGGSYMDAVAGWGWAVGFDLRLLRP